MGSPNAQGCYAPLAYLCPGLETSAPGEGRATSLPYAGCRCVKHGGHCARHQVSFRMWLCALLFQAGHATRKCCLGRKGQRRMCDRRGQQRERTAVSSSRPHPPYVRKDLATSCTCWARGSSVPGRLHQTGLARQDDQIKLAAGGGAFPIDDLIR
jgi:hypothetical protein